MTSTSPSRRVERKERLRGEILAAASKMFADRGYEAVTLRAIAKEIGYTHAVIYQHFPDKWHILAELSSETIGLLIQNFDAIAEEDGLYAIPPIQCRKAITALSTSESLEVCPWRTRCQPSFQGRSPSCDTTDRSRSRLWEKAT